MTLGRPCGKFGRYTIRTVASLLLLVLAILSSPTLPVALSAPPTDSACADCHKSLGGIQRQIAQEWERSIHAARGVGCADCHGGDPTQTDADIAMSLDAGFLGTPLRTATPDLCGSCHSDPVKMSVYELPTDQLRQYRDESAHGQLLAQGDDRVATCYDCHGGHEVREVNDPTSSVYPVNLPQTCANCHADPERMKPYGIPTDQYTLYKASVHGLALLEDHSLRAPTCATCHSNHGASLPGHTEVVEVCGARCHPGVQDAYLQSAHSSGAITEASNAPRCVTCHGRYDVQPATEALFMGNEPGNCSTCHGPGDAHRLAVEKIYNQLVASSQQIREAEAAIDQARTTGISVGESMVKLATARTRQMEAKVLQHTLQMDVVVEKTDQVRVLSAEIVESLEKRPRVSNLELQMMIGGIGGATLVGLVVLGGLWVRDRRKGKA